MGTCASLAGMFSFSGVWFDRYGARPSYALGGSLSVGGLLLTSWGLGRRLPAWLIGLTLAVSAQGGLPVIVAALETAKSFSSGSRGMCNGFLLAGIGMTPIAMAQVCLRHVIILILLAVLCVVLRGRQIRRC